MVATAGIVLRMYADQLLPSVGEPGVGAANHARSDGI